MLSIPNEVSACEAWTTRMMANLKNPGRMGIWQLFEVFPISKSVKNILKLIANLKDVKQKKTKKNSGVVFFFALTENISTEWTLLSSSQNVSVKRISYSTNCAGLLLIIQFLHWLQFGRINEGGQKSWWCVEKPHSSSLVHDNRCSNVKISNDQFIYYLNNARCIQCEYAWLWDMDWIIVRSELAQSMSFLVDSKCSCMKWI